jgi:hypothetical protein
MGAVTSPTMPRHPTLWLSTSRGSQAPGNQAEVVLVCGSPGPDVLLLTTSHLVVYSGKNRRKKGFLSRNPLPVSAVHLASSQVAQGLLEALVQRVCLRHLRKGVCCIGLLPRQINNFVVLRPEYVLIWLGKLRLRTAPFSRAVRIPNCVRLWWSLPTFILARYVCVPECFVPLSSLLLTRCRLSSVSFCGSIVLWHRYPSTRRRWRIGGSEVIVSIIRRCF